MNGLLLVLAWSGVEFVDVNLKRQPVNTVIPEYPEKARRDRVEGDVTVCFRIDRAGKPRDIAVRRSSNRQFEKAAKKAVRRSRYLPLEEGEEPSVIKSCRTYSFRLEPVDSS